MRCASVATVRWADGIEGGVIRHKRRAWLSWETMVASTLPRTHENRAYEEAYIHLIGLTDQKNIFIVQIGSSPFPVSRIKAAATKSSALRPLQKVFAPMMVFRSNNTVI